MKLLTLASGGANEKSKETKSKEGRLVKNPLQLVVRVWRMFMSKLMLPGLNVYKYVYIHEIWVYYHVFCHILKWHYG